MRKATLVFCLLLILLPLSPATAQDGLRFDSVPAVLRPGKTYDFTAIAAQDTVFSAILMDTQEVEVYAVFRDYPLTTGENPLHWDGLRAGDASPIDAGEYTLRVQWTGGQSDLPLRIGAAYPLLSQLEQSDAALLAEPVTFSFRASEAGTVRATVRDPATATMRPVATVNAAQGDNSFTWDGTIDGNRLPDGLYTLTLTMRAEGGAESMPHALAIDIGGTQAQTPAEDAVVFTDVQSTDAPAATTETQNEDMPPALEDALPSGETTPSEETAAPTASGQKSPPYSAVDDGTYWSMTPGELDDAAIWEVMMQPITIYDGGLDQREHVYLMENPDGTGKRVAQIHAQAQGIHLLGEPNEHGYVLAEAFSSYDDKYKPETSEEKTHAFDLKQGYIKASGLKEIAVREDMALLLDKLTQRMYLFVNGERVTEFLISTGVIDSEKYYQETTVGEFITVSHTGTLVTSKYMHCDMAIRINGGILIHEVPHEPLRDGSKRYGQYEAVLGQKASHGCIRVQRQMTPEGYNHQWLWDNFKPSAPYKVLIWDDSGRVDTPTTWQPNAS